MKSIQVEVQDMVAEELEAARQALIEILRHNKFRLLEKFPREDVAWLLQSRYTDRSDPLPDEDP
jgi:hypothetical protein